MVHFKFLKNALLGIFLLFVFILSSTTADAQGLMVNPKRVVFEGNKRNDVVTLFNNGSDTASFVISYQHYKMLESGEFQQIPDSVSQTDVLYSDKMVRYFPKEITLAPNASQTIRLQYSKPKDLAPGEYRSHLYFRNVERVQAIEATHQDTVDKRISISLKPVFGIAIPIIARNQTSPATVSLSNPTLLPPDSAGTRAIAFEMNRSGNESCYGQFMFTYVFDGKETELTQVKGVGVYVPLLKRKMRADFKTPAGLTLQKGGTIKIVYSAMTGADTEPVLATTELKVN
jgi:hypothetical protein